MATDVLFNFYEILVENIFGSIGIAIVGMLAVIVLILVVTKSSKTFILFWTLFYALVMLTYYFGSLGVMIGFLFSVVFFIYSFVRTFMRGDK